MSQNEEETYVLADMFDKIRLSMRHLTLDCFTMARSGKVSFQKNKEDFFFANKDKLLSQKPTPGTGPRWDKKASALYAKNWAEVGAKAMGVK